jgi:alditol oxidase
VQAAGFALANLASLPDITVAGACATGTHGSGSANAGLAAAVAAVELIGPDGELTELRRDADPDRFPGAAVNLGALGIVTRMTLDLEPTFDLAQYVHLGVPLDRLAEQFDAAFAAAYSVSAFTDWRSGQAAVWLKLRTDRPGSTGPDPHWLGGHPATEPCHPVPGRPATDCTEQFGVPGPWHERLPHFRPGTTPVSGEEIQSEFFLSRDAAADAFAALRGLGDVMAPLLQIAEIRTIAADELWLSPAYGRDTVAFHFTWIRDQAAVSAVVAQIEERLMPLGARPHWGKLFTTAPEAVGLLYERAGDFRRLMLDHDPAGKFRNPFLDGVLPDRP